MVLVCYAANKMNGKSTYEKNTAYHVLASNMVCNFICASVIYNKTRQNWMVEVTPYRIRWYLSRSGRATVSRLA